MIYIVLFFLFTGLFFYLLFGGADFGVGILELLSSKKRKHFNKSIIYRVIGPVWEANHVWLILVLVILWVGFPALYQIIVIQLHLPLTLLLFGIVFRGAAFIFRHYDVQENSAQHIYDPVFEWSSIFCTFIIGIIGGALVSGKMLDPNQMENASFATAYIFPWLNFFSVAMGLFFSSITAYVSSTFLISEVTGKHADYFKRKMLIANLATIITGGLVFVSAALHSVPFISDFVISPYGWFFTAVATLLLIPTYRSLGKIKSWQLRGLVITQLFCILAAYTFVTFPNVLFLNTTPVSIFETTAGDSVIQNLGVILIIGSLFILPGLYHLFKTFGLIKINE